MRARDTFVVIGIVVGLLFAPSIFFGAAKWIKNALFSSSPIEKSVDPRSTLPPYSHPKIGQSQKVKSGSVTKVVEPSEIFADEAKALQSFRSYVGWRRDPISLGTLEISAPFGIRKSFGERYSDSVWFFGGSTMWGTGAETSGTIPSLFHEISDRHVLNLGESNYNSRQGLNLLLNLLVSGHRPEAVVFFDGVNDVANQCRTEIYPPAHGLEQFIDETLRKARRPAGFDLSSRLSELVHFLIAPYTSIAHRLGIVDKYRFAVSQADQYNCNGNQEKTRIVVEELFANWRTVLLLSEYFGFEFRAVLQPNAWTTTSDVSYLNLRQHEVSGLTRQFETVYPEVQEGIESLCFNGDPLCGFVVDGSAWLDSSLGAIFIDYCHVTEVGNFSLAKRLNSVLP